MMDAQKTLAWLRETVTPIFNEARAGNVIRANALPPALRFYMDNILALRTIDDTTFAYQYPQIMEAADAMRVAQEHDTLLREQVAALPVMQSAIDALTQQVAELVAQVAALTAAPAKPAKSTPGAEPKPTQAEGEQPAATTGEESTDAPDSDDEPPAEPVPADKAPRGRK